MYDPTGHQPGAVPSRVLTALRGETKRLDVPAFTGVVHSGGNTEACPSDLATASGFERRTLFVSLPPAERAQDRAEACLSDLTAVLLSRVMDKAVHAQRMTVANHAAAQALLSAYVLWRAEAEAGGHAVPVPPLAPLYDAERGA